MLKFLCIGFSKPILGCNNSAAFNGLIFTNVLSKNCADADIDKINANDNIAKYLFMVAKIIAFCD